MFLALRRSSLNGFARATLLRSIAHKHLREGLLRRDGFKKFFFVNFLVCIKVDSSDDCVVILLICLLFLCVKESLKILLVDIIETSVIHCIVCSIFAESFG